MPNSPVPPPDQDTLRQAALSYLARYAATRASLRRALRRRVERWERSQPDRDAAAATIAAALAAVEAVIDGLVRAGSLNDAAFAETRARSLTRGGKSTRFVRGRLIAKGVAADLAQQVAAGDAESELAAALVLVRRRRLGAYRTGASDDPAEHNKALGVLARAGFTRDTAEQALATSRDDAEARIRALRQ